MTQLNGHKHEYVCVLSVCVCVLRSIWLLTVTLMRLYAGHCTHTYPHMLTYMYPEKSLLNYIQLHFIFIKYTLNENVFKLNIRHFNLTT